MTEVAESGHHDLCFLSEPCSKDVPEHGFCSRQSTFCIHCQRECICERLKQAENYAKVAASHSVDVDSYNEGRREALADAMQIVEGLPCKCDAGADYCDGQTDAIDAISTLTKGAVMTKHLPECWNKHESDPPAWCICDELRACEERVTAEVVQRVEAIGKVSQPKHEGDPYSWSVGLLDRATVIAAIKGDQP